MSLLNRAGFEALRWEALLAGRERRVLATPGLRPTAVLVPLFWRDDRPHLLFTKRSEHVSTHKSQICFPGGRQEPADPSLEATALRECAEEIGLPSEHVRVLGPLDDILTLGSVRITPFLAEIPAGWSYRTDPVEVEAVIEVPLEAFLLPANLRVENLPYPDGRRRDVYFYDVAGEVIWGATARIVKEWLALVETNEPFLS